MFCRQRFEFSHQLPVATSGEVGVDSALKCREAQFTESGDLRPEDRPAVDVGVRMPPPHRQGRPQRFRRGVGIVLEHREGCPHSFFEPDRIDRRGVDVQHVAATVLADDVAEIAPDRRDEGLDGVARTTGGILAVDAVDDSLEADRLPHVGNQQRQDAALLRTPHG